MIIKVLYTFEGILDISAKERLQESNPTEKIPFRRCVRPGDVIEVDDKFYDLIAIQEALRLGYIEIGGLSSGPNLGNTLVDGSYNGTTMTQTGGESLAFGDLVYYNNDGKVYKAKADSTATMICMGIAVKASASGTEALLLVDGMVRSSDRFSFTTGGQANSNPGILYVSATELGGMVQTPPDTYPNVVQIVGYATTSDVIAFKPDYTFIEIAPVDDNSSSSSSSS